MSLPKRVFRQLFIVAATAAVSELSNSALKGLRRTWPDRGGGGRRTGGVPSQLSHNTIFCVTQLS
jgi:hypothetical protein